jgi:hypothetical protein
MICFLALFALAAALSDQCDDGVHSCPSGDVCIESKFCLDGGVEQYPGALFVAGFGSFFVPANDVQRAACLEGIQTEVDDIFSAYESFSNGDKDAALKDLLSAFQSTWSIVSSCNNDDSNSFWSDVEWLFEKAVDYFCPQCDFVFTLTEFVVQGVDVFEDWSSMVDRCGPGSSPSDDDYVSCGQLFGDLVNRIGSIASNDAIEEQSN